MSGTESKQSSSTHARVGREWEGEGEVGREETGGGSGDELETGRGRVGGKGGWNG